jgi:hypothetical protein
MRGISDYVEFCPECGTRVKSETFMTTHTKTYWKRLVVWCGFLQHPISGEYYAVGSEYPGRILRAAGPVDKTNIYEIIRINGPPEKSLLTNTWYMPAARLLASWPEDTTIIGVKLQKEIDMALSRGVETLAL